MFLGQRDASSSALSATIVAGVFRMLFIIVHMDITSGSPRLQHFLDCVNEVGATLWITKWNKNISSYFQSSLRQ